MPRRWRRGGVGPSKRGRHKKRTSPETRLWEKLTKQSPPSKTIVDRDPGDEHTERSAT